MLLSIIHMIQAEHWLLGCCLTWKGAPISVLHVAVDLCQVVELLNADWCAAVLHQAGLAAHLVAAPAAAWVVKVGVCVTTAIMTTNITRLTKRCGKAGCSQVCSYVSKHDSLAEQREVVGVGEPG